MFSIKNLIRSVLVTGTVALCTSYAFAVDGSAQVPFQATVSTPTAVLFASQEEDAEVSATLSQGDTLVLLSREDSDGWYSAAYQVDEDTAVTGYISADEVIVQTLGQVTVLTDDAVLLEETETESEEITSLGEGANLQVCGYNDGWFLVSAKNETGYVPISDVACDLVTTSSVNLRSQPNTKGKVLEVLDEDVLLTPLGIEDDWYLVSYEGQEGYVSSKYVSPADEEEFTVENPALSSGEAVLAYAQQFLGNPYVWGGTSLTNGCDCSGYVMQIYAQFGVSLPHSSAAMRSCGTKVSYSEMEVGDVVCYSGHVGIYAGDGQIINALNSRSGICYTNVNYAPIVTIRRML